MGRFRVSVVCAAFVLLASVVPIVLTGAVEPAGAVLPTCALPAPVAGVITLSGDCVTTVPLTVPNGVTLNGAGHTISAHDTTPGSFNGSVVANAGGATSMKVENLKIMGAGFVSSTPCRAILNGISFSDAGGSVTNVTVTGITDNSSCQVGRGIVASGLAGQTLTITGTTVSGYQKAGIQAAGVTMNVSATTVGPPASLPTIIAQNGLVYTTGATGTTAGSTIFGSGFGSANHETRLCSCSVRPTSP